MGRLLLELPPPEAPPLERPPDDDAFEDAAGRRADTAPAPGSKAGIGEMAADGSAAGDPGKGALFKPPLLTKGGCTEGATG